MKKDKIEYYPNGRKKHVATYLDDSITRKICEFWYNDTGYYHNLNNPDYASWDVNAKLIRKTYCIHNKRFLKLHWTNCIKKI
jgi:hypothetical protein